MNDTITQFNSLKADFENNREEMRETERNKALVTLDDI